MNLWQGLVLGLVQGLTEFLPVSSSGHLVLTEHLLGAKMPGVFFEVSLHVATLASVLVVYGRRLWAVLVGVMRRDPPSLQYAAMLVLGTIPAGVIGAALHHQVEAAFSSLPFVGGAFILTGVILWSTRHRGGTGPLAAPRVPDAVAVGLAQAFAILPGISRSGSTISAALWRGMGPAAAAEFSFLLAVPVIAGAALLEGRHAVANVGAIGLGPFVTAFAAAFASGIWAIRWLVALLTRGRFYAFAPYCWAVGLFTLAYALWHG